MAYQDTWTPAGVAGVFSFLPLVNLYAVGTNGRRRLSDTGTLLYSSTDAPDNELTYAATRTTTYWTEYDLKNHVYFEYFAGSSLLTTDAMYGRLNRRYDMAGNQLQYSYGPNSTGNMLLRNITGFGGNVVPYFQYDSETIDSTHFAPITGVLLADQADATQNRTIYFAYQTFFNYPYLATIVQPGGCAAGFLPSLPFDGQETYHIGAEVDASGYTTYFTYASNTLTRMVEPEGRLAYYNYSAALTSRADLNRSPRFFGYQTNTSGDMPLLTLDQDSLGNTTYYVFDPSVTRVNKVVRPNGGVETFGMVGGASGVVLNRTAIAGHTWTFNGASIYFEYDSNTFDLNKQVGPRNVPGVFPVVTYYSYDSQQNPVRSVNALGQTTVLGRNAQGNIIRRLDAQGYSTYFTFDAQTGFLTSYLDPQGNSGYFSYNSFGDRTATVSPRWQNEGGFPLFTTYFAYDLRSHLLRRIDPLGQVTYFDWTSRGDLFDIVDPRGIDHSFAYNGLRLPTQETWTDGTGNVLSQVFKGYDIYKNLVQVLDPRGFASYFFYDQIDRKTAQTDALANVTYYFYDSVNNLTQRRDARGNTTYFAYDLLSRKTARCDALGNTIYFTYDLADNKTREVNPRGAVTYFFYDALDRPNILLDAVGNSTYFFYDPVGNVTQIRNGRGNATYFFYDGLKRKVASQDSLGRFTYYTFDRAGNQNLITDALGGVTRWFFDRLDRPSCALDAVASATYFAYDAVGNQTSVLDARGNAVYFEYDGLSRLIERDDPQGGLSAFTRDASGNVTQKFVVSAFESGGYGSQSYGTSGYGGTSDAEGQYFYDSVNRLQAAVDPVGNATYYSYDVVSNVTGILDARGNTNYFHYDAINRLSTQTDPLGNAMSFFYDGIGNRTVLVDANVRATYFGYDAINRLIQIQDALGGTTYYQYDPMNNQTKVLDPDGHMTQAAYDSLDRRSAIRMPDTGSSYFFYDVVNNRTMHVDPRGNATYFGYDLVHRITRLQDALGRTAYFEYDAVSNLSRYVDAEGASSANVYDSVNNRTQTTYTAGGSVLPAGVAGTTYFAYDLARHRTQMVDLWGAHQFVYDPVFRPTIHRYPNGSVIYYEYDGVSNVTARAYPGASGKAQAAYDQANRQTLVQAPSGATAYFKYDPASNQSQRLLGNGVRQDVTFDVAERVSKWRNTNKSGASLTYFDYTRDAKGLITQAVREASYTIYYSYDSCDRLMSEIWAKTGATPSEVYGYRYAYDVTGNRTKLLANGSNTYYFYDQANQLKVSGTTSAWATPSYYIYDKNGSLTNLVEPAGATYFGYNAGGLVARIRWKDASATYFFYDGNLQRYGMVAFGTATYFLWDGPNLLQELNADGTVKEEYTNARMPIAGIGQLLEINRPGQSPQKIYPIMDSRGTVTKQLQSDGTTVQAAREYDAFGNLIPNSTSGTWIGRFGYQGQAWIEIGPADASKRLLLSPLRLYDPVTGRFVQNETILNQRPDSQFKYSSQNPVGMVDPTGAACLASSSNPDDDPQVPSIFDPSSPNTYVPPTRPWSGNLLDEPTLLPIQNPTPSVDTSGWTNEAIYQSNIVQIPNTLPATPQGFYQSSPPTSDVQNRIAGMGQAGYNYVEQQTFVQGQGTPTGFLGALGQGLALPPSGQPAISISTGGPPPAFPSSAQARAILGIVNNPQGAADLIQALPGQVAQGYTIVKEGVIQPVGQAIGQAATAVGNAVYQAGSTVVSGVGTGISWVYGAVTGLFR